MNTIISCPTCQKKLRAPANKRIYFNCVNCGTLIHLANGAIVSSRERIELKEEERGNQGRRSTHQGTYRQASRANTGSQPSFWASIPSQAKWSVAAAAILFFSVLAYQLSQVEHRYFADIMETEDAGKIKRYLNGYSDGLYRAQVTRLRDSLTFVKAYFDQQKSCNLESCDCSQLAALTKQNLSYDSLIISAAYEDCLLRNVGYHNSFIALNTYREAFPQGRYMDSVNMISNQLWQGLRQQYTHRISSQQVTAKARQFFQQLLNFGQASGHSAIRVNFGYELALKDWEDYPQETYQFLDMMTEMSNTEQQAKYPKPSAAPPPSIRNYFRTSNNDLQQIIVNALQNRLDSVFVPNPFQLQHIDAADNAGKAPTILIDYKIETLADQMGDFSIPTLYIQQRSIGLENASNESEMELRRLIARSKQGEDVTAALQALQKKIEAEELEKNPYGQFQGYLLATSIDWQMEFNIPDSTTSFAFQTISRPNSSFSNIQSNQDAYRRMMESTFVNYAVQLAEGFGI